LSALLCPSVPARNEEEGETEEETGEEKEEEGEDEGRRRRKKTNVNKKRECDPDHLQHSTITPCFLATINP
jgi:hypothetical protein